MIPKLSALTLCLLLAIVSGCNEADQHATNTDPNKLLSLSVDESYNTSKSEDWIIIHDENGKAIASQSFEANQKIVLETNQKLAKNTIGITFLKITASKGQDYFLLKSYLNVERGKKALLRTKTSADAGKNVGIFELDIEGSTSPDQFSLSTENGLLYTGSVDNRKLKLKGFLYSKSSDYLFQMTDVSGNARYKMLKDVKRNKLYSIAFDELESFDKIVEFSFPVCNHVDLVVKGKNPNQTFNDSGYFLNNHFVGDYHSQIKVGYLKTLSKYETELSLKYADYGYVYKNVGSIPDGNINWPSKSAYQIIESGIENFSAKAAFIWRESSWKLKNSDATRPDKVVWHVYSSSPEQHINELPNEILSDHPTLALKNLEYAATTFYTLSEPYATYLDKILNDSDKSATEPLVGIRIY